MISATRQRTGSSASRLGRVAALVLPLAAYGMLPSAALAGDDCDMQEQQEAIGATASRDLRTRSDLAGVSVTTEIAAPLRQQAGRPPAAAQSADSIVSRLSVGSSLPLRL
jgi:hypothetical protein